MDRQDAWSEYRREVQHYQTLLTAKQKRKQSFLCYHKLSRKSHVEQHVVLLERNTRFRDFFFWFIFPIAVLALCCVGMILVCYWFCYPCERGEADAAAAGDDEEYHEMDRSDYSEHTPGGGGAGGGGPASDSGGWPTRGPSDGDTGNWPLYWR